VKAAFKSGVLLSLTNPQNVAYWAAMGSALRAVGVTVPTPFDYGVFFAGFMLSSIVWAFFVAAVVDRVFRRAGRQWARVTYRLCAIAFLALALSLLREVWRGGDMRNVRGERITMRVWAETAQEVL
jgi:chemosensory pili system protein ChpE